MVIAGQLGVVGVAGLLEIEVQDIGFRVVPGPDVVERNASQAQG
jgi:hypothetical protein